MAKCMWLTVMVMVLGLILVSAEPSPSQLAVAPAGNVGFEVSQLYVRSNTPKENPRVYIGTGEKTYSVGINSNGEFSIALNVNKTQSQTDLVVVNNDTMSVSNMLARTVHADQVVIRGVPQWQLIREDVFANPTGSMLELSNLPGANKYTGWVSGSILSCAGLSMLAIEDFKKPIEKAFSNLPPHTHIRIVATGHFVDDWQGETAFMRLNDQIVWTESHELRNGLHALSVCGSDRFPETRFVVPIDITIPHAGDKFRVSFGTTLESSSEARFGVSSVSIYTRNVPKV